MKIRVRYTKVGPVRFTSHRDVARLWERAIRIARLPIAYSEGFSPRPKVSFGLALPTTFESLAEYIDIAFTADVDPSELPDLVNPGLPDGLAAVAAGAIEPGTDSLQQAVTSSTWQLDLIDVAPEAVADWIDGVQATPVIEIVRERKGKKTVTDVAAAILSLATTDVDAFEATGTHAGAPPTARIIAELANQPLALRPNELLGIHDPSFNLLRGRRVNQWIASDGARREPLPAGAAATRTHSELCAS